MSREIGFIGSSVPVKHNRGLRCVNCKHPSDHDKEVNIDVCVGLSCTDLGSKKTFDNLQTLISLSSGRADVGKCGCLGKVRCRGEEKRKEQIGVVK